MDILARDDAPLSAEQWAELDEIVVGVARKYLVGRRLLPLFGPLGAGMPVVPKAALEGLGGEEPITAGDMELIPLEEISRDFVMDWRDFEGPERVQIPVSWAPAAAAAQDVARQEDAIVFTGSKVTGSKGLVGGAGQKLKSSGWAEPGALLADYARAVDLLGSAGFPGPYALVVSPGTYAQAHRPMGQGGQGQLEIQLIKQQAEGGVFASGTLKPTQALVLEPGAMNADLALGLDLVTAYLGAEEMRHPFRILETVALRIKRPDAIVAIA